MSAKDQQDRATKTIRVGSRKSEVGKGKRDGVEVLQFMVPVN